MNPIAELDTADSSPEFLMVEGSGVARIGPRNPCPAGHEMCGYRAVVFRTGTGCEYRGFLCGSDRQSSPCLRRGWLLGWAWPPWRRLRR